MTRERDDASTLAGAHAGAGVSGRARTSRPIGAPERVGVAAWIALVVLQFAWYFGIAPPAAGTPWIALTLTLPPLLLPLFALRSGLRRALLWVGVVALFVFCHGIVAAWTTSAARVPAVIESVLCVVLIGTLGWSVRQDRARRAASRTAE